MIVPFPLTATGIAYRVGGTQSGNVRVGLARADGTVYGGSLSVAQNAINTHQSVPFALTLPLTAGMWYALIQFSSGTGTAWGANNLRGSATSPGSYVLPTSITVPSAATGFIPVMELY